MPRRGEEWRAAYAALLKRAVGGDAQWVEGVRPLVELLGGAGVPVEDVLHEHVALCHAMAAAAGASPRPEPRPCDAVLGRVVSVMAEAAADRAGWAHARIVSHRLFDDIPVGLYRTTHDGQIMAANSTLVGMLGSVDLGALLQASAADFYVHPEQRARRLAEFGRSDSVFGVELELRRCDGRPLWVSDHSHAVRDGDGRVLYYEGVLLDITERKRAEHELHERWARLETLVADRTRELQHAKDVAEHELIERRRAEEAERVSAARFRQLFDQSPIAAAIIGLDGRFERVNDAFCALLGFDEQELVGRTIGDVSYDDGDAIALDDARSMRLGESDAGVVERRFIRKDGQVLWVRVSTRAIRDSDGRPVHFFSLVQDITGEKQAADLVRLQRDLGAALLHAANLGEALDAILDAAMQIEGVDAGGVYVVAPATGELVLVTHRRLSSAFVAAVSSLAADSPQAQFVRQGAPLYASVHDSPYTADLLAAEGLRSLAAIPVLHAGRAVACLNVASRSRGALPQTARDALESLAGRVGAVVDRMHDREALLASERLFRTLMDTIPALAVIVEGERIVYINNAGAAMLGYSAQEVTGRRLVEFLPAANREAMIRRTLDRQSGREAPQRYELPVLTRDGVELWLDMSAARIEYQNRPAALGVALDISERRRVEQSLRVMQERLAAATQAAELGVWDWNVATGEVSYSDRWQSMLGYEPGELEPHYRSWENLLHTDDRPRVLDILSEHLAGRSPDYAVEMRLRTKSGDWKWVLASGKVVLRDADGRPLRMTGTHLDISARKTAEELARQHSEQLAHVSRVSTIGEMASALAHEMAQPLSAILYYARGTTARMRRDATPAHEVAAVFDKIALQAARAGEFIRQIKAFVRNARPTHVLSDANEPVIDAVALAEPLIRQNGVDLRLDLAHDLPPVVMDKIQIEQVLLNLIRNAVEAMERSPRAGRRIEIQTAQAPDQSIHYRVSDAGPGIPSEAAARVFEPFYTTKPGGTGLGLSISRSIIEAHDGTLRIQSSERDGTVVWFTLPIATEPAHVNT